MHRLCRRSSSGRGYVSMRSRLDHLTKKGPCRAHDSRMSRRGMYAAAAVILIVCAALAVTALRDRDAAGTPPSPSVPPSTTATAVVTSPTDSVAAASPTPARLVLSDRFGFLVHNRDATVRSETSDTVVSSFAPQ